MEARKAALELIAGHRSIRRYRPEDVPEETLRSILSTAIRASSSGNMQPYSVIVTRDPALRRRLHEPHFRQDQVLEAPVLLTFCADFRRMRKWLRLSDAPDQFDNLMSFMIGAIDAILVSQNAALAAEAHGLGICYLGTTLASCGEIAEILGCPDSVVPVVGFTLGFPAEDPPPRDRIPLDALVHRERYLDRADDGIREAYAGRERSGWARYFADPELRARVRAAGASNLAQVYTKVKYTRESHRKYSRIILETLKGRAFFED